MINLDEALIMLYTSEDEDKHWCNVKLIQDIYKQFGYKEDSYKCECSASIICKGCKDRWHRLSDDS